MKSTGFVLALLFLQASASFFDSFRGAISKVENSFGKLLSDVVTDVKDAINNTISAVKRVFVQNGVLDQNPVNKSKYKMNEIISPPVNIRDRRSSLDSFNRIKPIHHLGYLHPSRRLSLDLSRSIANVDKTIQEILGYREVNKKLKDVSEKLKDETNRLEEISDMLQRELEKLSSSIRNQLDILAFGKRESTIESVWGGIQTLHNIQQHSKNSTEINEIRNVLDKVVNKLDINTGSDKRTGTYDMNHIKEKLQKITNNNNVQKQADNNLSAHIKSRKLTINKPKTDTTPVIYQNVGHDVFRHEKGIRNATNPGKSVFSFDLDALDGFTPFSKTDLNNKKAVDDAKKMIEDSKRTDKALNDFFKTHRGGPDVFSNPDLFNFRRR